MKDNFWQMGETGPCGPCSEIFYDMGQAASETPEKDLPFGEDDARYVEIWNLVFMQFDRSLDAKTGEGILIPLPKPSIDTGAGLERHRRCAARESVSNFETDLFTPLIAKAEQLTGTKFRMANRVATPVCASLPIMPAPPPFLFRMAYILRMKVAAMSCARFSVAAFVMAVCLARKNPSCIRWSTPFAMTCKMPIRN